MDAWLLRDHGRDAGRRHAAPRRRQNGKYRPVAIPLRLIGRQRFAAAIDDLAQASRAGEIAVQIIEGAIFGVNDHDGVDFVLQRAGSCGCCAGRTAGRGQIFLGAAPERPRDGQGEQNRRVRAKPGEMRHGRKYKVRRHLWGEHARRDSPGVVACG